MKRLYFAYGSNMQENRMRMRCPSAICVGVATLRGYRLVERLYADIQRDGKASVTGVLWQIDECDLARLDACEGTHRGIYQRRNYTVDCHGKRRTAVAYEMTDETRAARNGMKYPDWYRATCNEGAREHMVKSEFAIGA